MAETSTKPYLVRALYEWCCDNGYTPYLAVSVDARTRVPMQYVKNGEIVLNVSLSATHQLQIGNDLIEFQARFSGVAQTLSIPIGNVTAIYARETGHGMAFEITRPALPVADDGDELARRRQGQQGGDGERRRDAGERSEGGRSDGGRGSGSPAQEAAAGSAESGGAEVIAFGPDAARRRRRGDGGRRDGGRDGDGTGTGKTDGGEPEADRPEADRSEAGQSGASEPADAAGPSPSRSADRPARPARDERRGRRGEGRDAPRTAPAGSPQGIPQGDGHAEAQPEPAARPMPTVAPPSTAGEPVAAEPARQPRQTTFEGFEGGGAPSGADDDRDATSGAEPPDDDGSGGGRRPRLTRVK